MIFGATSSVAQSITKIYAKSGYQLILVARSMQKLDILKSDLINRYRAKVETRSLDAANLTGHQVLFKDYSPDIFIVCHGTLTNQQKAQLDFDYQKEQLQINLTSYLSLLTHAANYFEKKGSGTIAAIGSVAGDRGRMSNYVYGTFKAAIETYMQGLRHRLASHNVNALHIKPGFIDTPMTAHIQPKGALWAKPDQVAKEIVKAIKHKRSTIYTPSIWKLIMMIIRTVPEFIFHKTKL